MCTTKFPLTDAVATASAGGYLGHQLKWAGYDHVTITGKAEGPVYLRIFDDDVEICDAEWLWGKGVHETTDILRAKYGQCSVYAIGQAGENLVAFALGFVDQAASLGRGGLGAVMGSKRLKAIVATGTKGLGVADPKRFMQSVDCLFERRRKWAFYSEVIAQQGIAALAHLIIGQQAFTKNWTETYPEERFHQVWLSALHDGTVKRLPLACGTCFAADKDIVELTGGEYRGLVLCGERALGGSNLGMKLGIEDYGKAAKLTSVLDDYGLCHLTFGTIADFLIDICEKGIISEDEVGLPLRRDFDSVMNLAQKITFREGFGDIVAGGWREAIEMIGRGAENHAVIIKGLDPQIDGRISNTNAFEQVVCPRGPSGQFLAAGIYGVGAADSIDRFKQLADRQGVPASAIDRMLDSPLGVNTARLAKYDEDWAVLFNCLGLCGRGFINRFYTPAICAEIYSAATGIESGPQDLLAAAERSFNLWKALNVREGFSRKDDTFPEIWFGTITDSCGKTVQARDFFKKRPVSRAEFHSLLDDYYNERGWDVERGIPTKAKLKEMGLEYVAQDLLGRGLL
jgi:aldehyde:ferredoxin oxidoreductase